MIEADHVDRIPTPIRQRGRGWLDDGMQDGMGPGRDIQCLFLLVHAPPHLWDPRGDALSSRDGAVPAGSRRRLVRGERAGSRGHREQRAPP